MTTITRTLVWILRWTSDSASTTSGYESERPSDYNSVSSGDYASVLPATISTGRPRLRTGRLLRHRLAGSATAKEPRRLNGSLETCHWLRSHLHTGHIPANLSSWFLQQPKYDGTKITEM